MHDKRVKPDETRVVIDCARFLVRKNTGKIKTMHGMTMYTKKCKIKRSNGIRVIGRLAKAKMIRKAIIGVGRR